MTRDELLDYCLTKPGAWPDDPWEGDLVAKVDKKIFAFLGDSGLGLKCGSREEADEWLSHYPDDATVMPYLGRYGWNTLKTGGAISDAEILEAIDDSYRDVVARLPKSRRPTADESTVTVPDSSSS